MRLKVLQQMHVSAVKADTLRPHEEFEINDAAGDELLKHHPQIVMRVEGAKAESAPLNKMEPPPLNKADYPSLKVNELKALAAERGVDLTDCNSKADIVAAFQLADEAAAEAPDGTAAQE